MSEQVPVHGGARTCGVLKERGTVAHGRAVVLGQLGEIVIFGHWFVGERFVGERFVGERFVGERFVGERFVGERFVGERFVGERFVGERFVGKRFMGERFVGERFVGERFVGERFVGERFVGERFVCERFVCERFVGERFVGENGFVAKERILGRLERVDVGGLGARRRDARAVVKRRPHRRRRRRVVLGQITTKVTDEGVERPGAKQLQGKLPLFGADETRVGDYFNSGRLEAVVELAQALLLAVGHAAVELVGRGGVAGELVDVRVEGLGVEDGRREGVVALVERAKQLLPPHAKLPRRP